MRPSSVLTSAVVVCGGIVVATAGTTAVAVAMGQPGLPFPPGAVMKGLLVLIFLATGLALVLPRHRESRATFLGTAFILVAAVFAHPFSAFAGRHGYSTDALDVILSLTPDAFLAYFVWRFVSDFPRESVRRPPPRTVRLITHASGLIAVILFVANLAALWFPWATPVGTWLWSLSRRNQASLYWPAIYGPCLGAIGYMLWRVRRADTQERRRVSVALWGIAAGAGPMVLWTIGSATSAAFTRAFPLDAVDWLIYPALLLCPIAVAYAVVVDRALDVRLIVRAAVQYALARYTVIAAATVPLIAILVLAYRDRALPTAEVLFNDRAAALVGTSLLMVGLLASRRGILERIDRRFFREQYDAGQTIRLLAENCRWAGSREELSSILVREIEAALHPVAIDVLLLDSAHRRFDSPLGRNRSLPAGSGLVAPLERTDLFIDMSLEREASIARTLTADDQHWLADSNCRFLVPLRNPDHLLTGLIALGEKRSEMPYTRSDWSLLSSVASSAEMALVFHGTLTATPAIAAPRPVEVAAGACDACGLVSRAEGVGCPACGGAVHAIPLPTVIASKVRLEQRIGTGGMGVVYRATDLELDRQVAVKTLPFASPDGTVRLRHEARAMARVNHPHLALIFGAESWKGLPLLLVEYLPGGSLADRLAQERLTVRQALSLGRSLAAALRVLHEAGILHRDIKPSNIGYAADGTPKLLDFGIATATQTGTLGDSSGAGRVAAAEGTLPYAEPEVVRGTPPTEQSDLWGLALTLYEAVAGVNPLVGADYATTKARVMAGMVPDIREFAPLLDPAAATLFARMLRPDRKNRPASAEEMIAIIGGGERRGRPETVSPANR